MEEHEVKTVRVMERASFKNVQVDYEATYFFCDAAEELYMNESQIQENDIAIKDAYRRKQRLLTSNEINAIRGKYGISQSDLCILLGWGGKTITRYETHQVQDKAHDTILKKLNQDPQWFLDLLIEAKNNLLADSYRRYLEIATVLYENDQDRYLRKAIEAKYARYQSNQMFQGNAVLSLDKVVDVIRYFAASTGVTSLYKVKLMKLMWYSDALSYIKREGVLSQAWYIRPCQWEQYQSDMIPLLISAEFHVKKWIWVKHMRIILTYKVDQITLHLMKKISVSWILS